MTEQKYIAHNCPKCGRKTKHRIMLERPLGQGNYELTLFCEVCDSKVVVIKKIEQVRQESFYT